MQAVKPAEESRPPLREGTVLHFFEYGAKEVQLFDVAKNVLTKRRLDMEIPDLGRTIAVDDERIFLIGGSRGETLSSAWEYNASKHSLSRKAGMKSARRSFGIVLHGAH